MLWEHGGGSGAVVLARRLDVLQPLPREQHLLHPSSSLLPSSGLAAQLPDSRTGLGWEEPLKII